MIRDTDIDGLVPGPTRKEVGDIRPGVVLRETYRVLDVQGEGGMATVFAASHERLPGLFAVKALHSELLRDAEHLARFRAEAEVTARLRHPHIIQILDFDVTAAGVPYLVMELVEGMSLRQAMEAGPVDPSRVGRIVGQIASALQVAHQRGVMHRDLKPENVMLLPAGPGVDFVKVVDFGLSKLVNPSGPPVTRPNQIMGTPGYMAPEQIVGRALDQRLDQFALAVVAFELLARRPPFLGGDVPTLLRQIVDDDPPTLASLVPWPAAAVSTVLARGMARERDARYPTVMEFDGAFQAAILEDAGTSSEVEKKPPDPALDGDSPDLLDLGRDYRW